MVFVNKSIFFRFFTLLSVVLFTSVLCSHARGQGIENDVINKIVIDPGHGGSDPGTIGSKSYEKNIALSIALKLGELIKDTFPNLEIIYTRNSDKFIPLDERTRIANSEKADLFISIHCNANPNKSPYGTETYVLGLHKSEDNLDVAMRENSVISYEDDYSSKYEGYDPKSTESYIIFTLMQNAYLDQSLKLANNVQKEFREQTRRYDRGVKQAGFLVLWKTSMPSILIETGFLSNSKEEAYLITNDGQNHIANAIFTAFCEYKRAFDTKSYSISKIQPIIENDSSISKKEEKTVITFKVQIKSSRKRIPITPKNFKNLNGIDEIVYDGIYKYTIGNKNSYSEIVEYCQQIRKKYPDAFIIALKGSKIIPLDIALKEISI